MKLKTISLFLSLVLITSVSYGQRFFNVTFGIPKIEWDYDGNFDGLRTVNRNSWSIGISVMKKTPDNWIYGAEAGINRFGNVFRFANAIHHISSLSYFYASPFVEYELNIPNTKISIIPKICLSAGFIPLKDQYYIDDMSFQSFRRTYKDSDGNLISEPLYDLTYTGSQIIENNILLQINPELEFHYQLNDVSSIFLNVKAGISLRKDVVKREFSEIIYEGENYHATHDSSLSFTMIGLGYQFQLR
tara:strand:+ start:95 stop:832 length:738 start_codon:yes stop_codon:yes gene_type:complete